MNNISGGVIVFLIKMAEVNKVFMHKMQRKSTYIAYSRGKINIGNRYSFLFGKIFAEISISMCRHENK